VKERIYETLLAGGPPFMSAILNRIKNEGAPFFPRPLRKGWEARMPGVWALGWRLIVAAFSHPGHPPDER